MLPEGHSSANRDGATTISFGVGFHKGERFSCPFLFLNGSEKLAPFFKISSHDRGPIKMAEGNIDYAVSARMNIEGDIIT